MALSPSRTSMSISSQGASQINGGGPRFFHCDDATKLRELWDNSCLAHPTLLLPNGLLVLKLHGCNHEVSSGRADRLRRPRDGWRGGCAWRMAEKTRLWLPVLRRWLWRLPCVIRGRWRQSMAAGIRWAAARSDLAAELGFFLHFYFFEFHFCMRRHKYPFASSASPAWKRSNFYKPFWADRLVSHAKTTFDPSEKLFFLLVATPSLP